jgi:hypothetical protein
MITIIVCVIRIVMYNLRKQLKYYTLYAAFHVGDYVSIAT